MMFKKILTALLVLPLLGANLLSIDMAHAAPTNLIANPSVDTAISTNSALPQGGLQGNWRTNNATFSYPTTGHTGRSVKVQLNSYSNGDAKWYFTPVAVTAGSEYTFSDYYESNITSDLVA